MTTYTNAPTMDLSSDASFRTFWTTIITGFTTCGLVQTSDTGQINWTTVTRPTAGGATQQVAGYEIYRFNDSLQATAPVYIKFEYGTNTTTSTAGSGIVFPYLAITVGSGTNGAGTLSGVVSSRRSHLGNNTSNAFTNGTYTPPSISSTCYYSGDTSSINFAIGANAVAPTASGGAVTQAMPWGYVGIERTRDISGIYDGNGVVLFHSAYYTSSTTNAVVPNGKIAQYQVLSFSGSGAGATDSYPPFAVPGSTFGTGTSGTTIATYPMPVSSPAVQGQLLGYLAIFNGDVALGTQFTVNVFGTDHNYISLAQVYGLTGTSSVSGWNLSQAATSQAWAVAMRYE